MLRVRQIIEPLVPRFDELLKQDLLPPNIELLFDSNKLVRYPPFVYTLKKKYSWAFSHHGIFMEMLLREMLTGADWKSNLYKLFLKTASFYTYSDISGIVTKKDLYDTLGRYVNISKYITTDFGTRKLLYDQEYAVDVLSGHPDIVVSGHTEIYDVKTTTKFNSPAMKKLTILQLSAYLSLERAMGHNPTVIGVILPFQQETLLYNLEYTDYNHKPFLDLLLQLARPRISSVSQQMEFALYTSYIGSHTKKIGGSVYKTLLSYYQDRPFTCPCQIFMRGNVTARKIILTDKEIAESLTYILQYDIRFFVHAPYIINLCHPCGNKTKDLVPKAWAIDLLREELQLAVVVGGRGVVVHTGKGMHLTEKEATDQMYNSVLQVLDSATDNCPLLLETPVDKGSELCGTPESMSAFYQLFSSEQHKRFKICVDTCHIFAAGYYPYDYLIKLSTLIGAEAIGLIHLNDAQWMKGSAHDGHSWIGKGCIGMGEMLKAIKWCVEREIPMVHE